MADRSDVRLPSVVVGCLMLLVACTTAVGSGSTGPAGPAAPASGPAATGPVRLLQMNLCNSGIAGCFTGRAPAEAAAVIRAEAPDLVTLNEVCRGDVAALERALAGVVPAGGVTSAFQPARNRSTGDAYPCRNGQEYGIGVVSRWPSVPGASPQGGIYPAQDPDDPEERAWLCLDVAAPSAVAVCTTHLAYTRRDVAAAQCTYLFGTVVAGLRAKAAAPPLVVGGDLNLGSGDGAELRACLPRGSALVDDGGEQHVVATPELAVEDTRAIDLRGTTDHPGLLVTLAGRPAS
jgi:endonuclease/exonuclease/phosphatase family metal-dependent hydrolase